jgi:hypothetical protein
MRAKTGGRQKGTPNRVTAMVKDAIVEAAEAVGEDGKGKGKLKGYLSRLAVDEPRAFAGLLGRVIPLQVNNGNGRTIQVMISEDDNKL